VHKGHLNYCEDQNTGTRHRKR